MLRYDRDWTLPQNVIDPASGVPRSAFFWDRKFSMGKRFRAKEHSIILVLSAWRPLMLNALTVASYLQRMAGLKEWLPPHNEGAWDTIGADDAIFAAGFDTDNTTLVYDKSDVWARGETFVNCSAADSPYPPYVSANSLESAGVDSQQGKFPRLPKSMRFSWGQLPRRRSFTIRLCAWRASWAMSERCTMSREKLSERFHERSLKALAGVHWALVALYDDLCAEAAQRGLFVVVTEGVRSEKRQLELVRSGVSLTLQSKHLTGRAIDIAIFLSDGSVTYQPAPYAALASAVLGLEQDPPLKWGGNWPKLRDYCHFEVA